MRDILFRGKRIDNDEWVYGSFCMDALEQFNGLCGVDGFIRLYDKTKCKMQSYEVDRETVGQYTGRTDKNGKRVFEGDILQLFTIWADGTVEPDEAPVVVRFWENDQCNVLTTLDGHHCDDFGNYGRPEYFEVIGNIHDNPELLKEGADNG